MASSREGGSMLFAGSMVGTLRLIAYLALAVALMVLDQHNSWMYRLRYAGSVVIAPLYRLAGLPSEGLQTLATAFSDRHLLSEQNRRLRQDLLLANAKLSRLAVVAQQNLRLQQLLDTQHSLDIHVQLAKVIGVDLGADLHRLTINLGARDGVRPGQPVIDAHGVIGQVVEVMPSISRVMLLTDPDHALPVTDQRSGVRTVAYGSRDDSQLVLPNISQAQDVKIGDQLLTSGLGGRFPAGFPVGQVVAMGTGNGAFQEALARPAADLNRSDEVLLLHDLADPAGPPPPAPKAGPPAGLASPPSSSSASGTAGTPAARPPAGTATTGPDAAPAVERGP